MICIQNTLLPSGTFLGDRNPKAHMVVTISLKIWLHISPGICTFCVWKPQKTQLAILSHSGASCLSLPEYPQNCEYVSWPLSIKGWIPHCREYASPNCCGIQSVPKRYLINSKSTHFHLGVTKMTENDCHGRKITIFEKQKRSKIIPYRNHQIIVFFFLINNDY